MTAPDRRSLTLFLLGLLALVVLVEAIGVVAGGAVDDLLLYLPGVDKALHFAGFAAITVTAYAIMRVHAPGLRRGTAALAIGLLALAAADELGQRLLSPRNLEMADFVANVCGVGFALALIGRLRRPRVGTIGAVLALCVAAYVTFESYTRQRHMNAGVRLSQAGDFAGARREYQRAFEAGVRTATLFNELGWVEIESGQGDARKAMAYAAQALAMRPADPDTLDTYGWALHHAGRSAEALPYLERAYAARPRMFCIHYHLGEVYAALGRGEDARRHFREQMASFPRTTEARRAERALATTTF